LLVARVAVATSIAPNELLEAPPEIFWAMVSVLEEQAQQTERAKGRR
jgi:hypothetical protein